MDTNKYFNARTSNSTNRAQDRGEHVRLRVGADSILVLSNINNYVYIIRYLNILVSILVSRIISSVVC